MSVQFTILGSGSAGNCAYVETAEARILVDAGFSPLQIRKRLATIESSTRASLSEIDLAKIDFLTPEGVAEALDALSAPVQESTVRGYKVKVTRSSVGAAEAQDRRASVTRIIAKSMQPGEGSD